MAGSDGLTFTVVGAGVMGVAITSGIMASLREPSKVSTETSDPPRPAKVPTKFIACDAYPPALENAKQQFSKYSFPVTTLHNDNLKGIQEADVILLACKPYMFREVLGEPGMREALAGKLLLTILAGVTAQMIEEFLYGSERPADACRVVRVMPNTAAFVRESMTVIQTSSPSLTEEQDKLVTWIFSGIGRVVHLPPQAMDAVTSLCGSGPAFMALVIEGMADGAVAMGIPRKEALMMAAQTMRGTAGLVLEAGEHPAILREKVSTPGGCTIGGSLVLEEAGVRGTIAKAVREATVVASQLGQGVKNVNGTRPPPI